jgi:acyl carrier protein
MMADTIQEQVKQYILQAFLPGENPDELSDKTPLISGGILDSIATLKLVMFLEETFQVALEAHEADREHLDTLADIAALVRAKKA